MVFTRHLGSVLPFYSVVRNFTPPHPQASNLKLFQDYCIHFRFSFIIEVILRYPISFHHAFHLVSIWGMKIGIFSQRLDLCLNSIKISLLYWLSTMGFVPLWSFEGYLCVIWTIFMGGCLLIPGCVDYAR